MSLLDSEVDSDDDSDVECVTVPMFSPTPRGNRLLSISSLKDVLEDFLCCRQCMEAGSDNQLEDFVTYCGSNGCDVSTLFSNWKATKKPRKCTVTIDEVTHGLATDLIIHCNRCSTLGKVDRRGWRNHCTTVESKKNSNAALTKSVLCHYDINVRFCLATQLLGLGGEHASVLCAFLDLPEPQKWRRHFKVLEKVLCPAMEDIKNKSQENACQNEVALTLDATENVVEQTLVQHDVPLYRVRASFDMGWQVRSSGNKYGSCSGHAFLIGALNQKIMDSVVYVKKCATCTRHEACYGTVAGVKQHQCVRNYDGSSKSMEASALVKMLSRMPEEKGVSICCIISDDDSCGRARARHVTNGGQLTENVEEPTFLADPSHRKRVFARAIYNLANAPIKTSAVTKGLAGHIKNCYGACVKRNRHRSATELSEKVQNILEHICSNHTNCDEAWCYDKKAASLGKSLNPPKDHRINKKDEKTYLQLKQVFDQYANPSMMAQCNHPFSTQTNEALNNAVANVAPKTVCYSGTISLTCRIALVVGIHNMGHVHYLQSLFDVIGCTMTPILETFFIKKTIRKEYKQNYVNKVEVKARRSKKQRRTWQEIYKERTDTSYGPGIGLVASAPKKKRKQEPAEKGDSNTCKCGSTTHKRTTHRDCPLRKRKEAASKLTETLETPQPNTLMAETVITAGVSSARTQIPTPTKISREGGGYDFDCSAGEDYSESERIEYMRHLTNAICLRTLPTYKENEDNCDEGR